MSNDKEKKQKERLNKIKSDLIADDQEQVLQGVEKAKNYGDTRIIPSLLKAYIHTEDETVEKKILEIFNDIKQTDAAEPLIEALEDPDLEDRSGLVAVFWNSRLDPAPFIPKFVEIAVEGSFQECFEALTVIEEMEGPFEEETVMEGLLWIKTYRAQGEDEKKDMIDMMERRLKEISDSL